MTTFTYRDKVAHFYNNMLVVGGKTVGEFKGIEEAKEYLESLSISEELATEIVPAKSQLTEEKVAIALYESGEERVSESVVRSYKAIVESKVFFPSDVVLNLRELYNQSPVLNKVDYVLRDGSTVMIDIETNITLNKIIDIKESHELLMYMTESKETFLKCLAELLGDY